MNKKTVIFKRGITGTDPITEDGVPHVAFIGRSNAGKSSVINSLLGGKYAKSSSMPGKTQELNFFLVDGKTYVVDLPGYGFARIPIKKRDKLKKLISWYFERSGSPIKKVVLVMDASVGLTALDIEMIDILAGWGHVPIVVANKTDRIAPSRKDARMREIREALHERAPTAPLLPYSAKDHTGREEGLSALFG